MTDPTLVYDDDCGFCTWAAALIASHAEVRVVGFSRLSDDLKERLPADFEECAHFVTSDTVYSCGEAVEEAFLHTELGMELRPVAEFARNFEEYGPLRERCYQFVADNRGRFGTVVSKNPPAGGEDD